VSSAAGLGTEEAQRRNRRFGSLRRACDPLACDALYWCWNCHTVAFMLLRERARVTLNRAEGFLEREELETHHQGVLRFFNLLNVCRIIRRNSSRCF